jgi:tRNA threonylcarbamoyl adenosine modification protein YeaZ
MPGVRGWILGLDCATAWRSLALWRVADDTVHREAERVERAMAGRLMPDLIAFLARHAVRKEQLQAIGVGVGPGSYTGVRIGIAAALGMGRSLGIPVTGSGTLEAIAYGALAPGATAWVVLPATRGRVHAARATRREAAVEITLGPSVMAREALPDDAAALIDDHPPDASWHARRSRDGGPPRARYA